MKIHELATCPGCRSGDRSDFAYGEGVVLRRCATCGLVYAPAYGDPEEIYVDGYLKGETDFGLDISDPHFQLYLSHVADARVRFVNRVVRDAPGTWLDVGCGSGELLAVARAAGWEVTGVEPVVESAQMARERGLDVRDALLQESGLPERHYDVVSAFHVLEHMNEGQDFLRLIARWARPGGHVVVEVPNWRSFHRLGAARVGAVWPGLRPLEHVAHYTPRTLEATLGRAGLEPLAVTTRSYVWDGQTLLESLRDLGRQKLRPRLRPLTRTIDRQGETVEVPNRVGRAVLRAIERTQDRFGTGVVVLAVARVP